MARSILLTVKTTAVLLQNALVNPNFGQSFCYSTSVPMSLQTLTVKTTAISLVREKLGQICHVFQIKHFLALFSLLFFLVFTLRSTNKAILVLLLQTLGSLFEYRTLAIISRGLYFLNPFFTAVYIQKRLILQTI